MKSSKCGMKTLVVMIALAGCVVSSPAADLRPAVLEFNLTPTNQVPVLRTEAIDAAALSAADALQDGSDTPYRFAVPQPVLVTLASDGRWEDPSPVHRVWRLRIVAPGALSVNLGFDEFNLPDGGQLSLYPTDLTGSDDPRGVRIFDASDRDMLGQLWTPVVLADDIIVEVMVPAGSARPHLKLAAINRGYRFFGEDRGPKKSGVCNIDVVCPEGDAWRDEISAVGVYTVDGVWKCTGSLINNTRQDGVPLFLTAFHCNTSMNVYANTVVVYWNYESPVCGEHGGGSLDDFQGGAIFRATSQVSDFTLIELDDPLDPRFGLTLAGWDRRDAAPVAAVAIHHPSTDEKSISFENDPLAVTTYLQTASPGDGTHLRVPDWDLGTTEPGSSGSPLFSPEHRIVGQLHGGYAACGNDLSDWYGRLFTSWTGGGSADSRLRDWLDPDLTGAEYLDTLDPSLPEQTVIPVTDLAFEVPRGGDFTPQSGSYFIDNIGETAINYQVSSDVDWLTIVPETGTLAPGVQLEVIVTPDAEAALLPVGAHTGTLIFKNQTNGLGDATRLVTVDVQSVDAMIGAPIPNPFTDFTVIKYVLPAAGPVKAWLLDVRGRRVRDFGNIDGSLGANELAWDGRDGQDRLVAAGVYFLRLESGGITLQTRITRTN